MTGEFSVCQFFPSGAYEYVYRFVDLVTAITKAIQYCTSVGARLGTTERVIVTDGGDCIVFEWTRADGVTFPPEHVGRMKGGVR